MNGTIRGREINELRPLAALVGSLCVAHSVCAQEHSESGQRQETLAEVVVTAQKKTERLQDVPVPVSAISADVLTARNQVRMQDYAREVPGFSLDTTGDGYSTLAIRGLTTGPGFTNATVGITVDDVPYGSSIGITYGPQLSPDLDPAQLQRVEVLRGPQGTLYGASSLGGLLKYVTKDPSLSQLKANVQSSGNFVEDGGTGYAFRGSVDLPLITDTLGVSISAFKRRDPGFVDNPTEHRTNVNSETCRADGWRRFGSPRRAFRSKYLHFISTLSAGTPRMSIQMAPCPPPYRSFRTANPARVASIPRRVCFRQISPRCWVKCS